MVSYNFLAVYLWNIYILLLLPLCFSLFPHVSVYAPNRLSVPVSTHSVRFPFNLSRTASFYNFFLPTTFSTSFRWHRISDSAILLSSALPANNVSVTYNATFRTEQFKKCCHTNMVQFFQNTDVYKSKHSFPRLKLRREPRSYSCFLFSAKLNSTYSTSVHLPLVYVHRLFIRIRDLPLSLVPNGYKGMLL